MTRIAGRGDPQRTLRLLWGEHATERQQPGPRPGLSVDIIAAAAIELAEGKAGASISMRALGQQLGCTPMALYTYVGGKEELLDLMFDRVHLTVEAPPPGPAADCAIEWSARLLDLYLRHPWVSEVSLARPVQGPGEQRCFEALLKVLEHGIRSRDNTATVVAAIYGLTRSAAQTITDARRANQQTEDSAWWARSQAAFASVVPDFAERFPRSAALAGQGSPSEPVASGTPVMERASQAQLARGVRLLLAAA